MILKLINKKNKGTEAENQACRFLQDKGLNLITRNYYCRQGEIDLIMNDDETTVFIEVRYRKNNHYGDAKESVTSQKQNKIRSTALHFIQSHPRHDNVRFDVIAITGEGSRQQLEWIQNAFY